MIDTETIGGDSHLGSLQQASTQAQSYTEFFRSDIYGDNASSFIIAFCVRGAVRLKDYTHRAEAEYRGNQEALAALAGKVKYVLAHLELARCYGKHIGIMTEHLPFRDMALTYVAIAQAEIEAVEHFHHS